jgi:hypothetical protein
MFIFKKSNKILYYGIFSFMVFNLFSTSSENKNAKLDKLLIFIILYLFSVSIL